MLQTRSLSVEATSALLEACRANGVSISNALIAAMALTATDFIDSGDVKKGKKRNYKVLQSLDMRRFGAQLDKCETGKSGIIPISWLYLTCNVCDLILPLYLSLSLSA